jgi:hypothetical protein
MTDTFRRACLVAASGLGCAFSAFQILHDVRVPVQLLPGAAARVNGRPIDLDSINRTVAGMDARQRRSESATRHDVLSRMIDEELLIQHALDSGAAETSPEVRAALVRSAITRVNAEAAAEPISDGELNEYFESHRQVYATAARFDVTPLYFESHDADAARSNATVVRASTAAGHTDAVAARARATAARVAIQAGTPFEQLLNTSERPPFDSPGQQITPRTLANYFGPATADAVDHLTPGQTTEVTQLGSGVVFIYLNNKIPGEVPSLASIRDLVAADAMRDRQERALEALVASLHQAARIELATSPNAASSSAALPSATMPNAASPAAPGDRPPAAIASR